MAKATVADSVAAEREVADSVATVREVAAWAVDLAAAVRGEAVMEAAG